MSLLSRFDPPAYLDDFDAIPGQREAWHEFVSLNFDASIEAERAVVTKNRGAAPGTVQFFNAARYDPGGPLVEQAISRPARSCGSRSARSRRSTGPRCSAARSASPTTAA